jgi:hypothetical protein
MASLNRSFSLPVSLSDRVSRLKVFSGAAGKDEVSMSTHARSSADTLGEHRYFSPIILSFISKTLDLLINLRALSTCVLPHLYLHLLGWF